MHNQILNIVILAYKRIEGIYVILELLSRCKTKNKFVIHIVTGHPQDSIFCQYCRNLISHYNTLNINLITQHHLDNDSSFIASIRYASQLPFKYTLRLDDDIFPSPQCIDFLIEHQHLLELPNILSVTPLASTEVPTFDMFIQDFCSKEEQESVTKHFKGLKFPTAQDLWQIDYSSLNVSTAQKWNPSLFYQLVRQIPSIYQGIHPIRLNLKANLQLHQIILAKFEDFLNNDNIHIDDTQYPYTTTGIMLMKNTTWQSILNDKDTWENPELKSCFGWDDEVPTNQYLHKTNSKILYLRGGYTIHPLHSTMHNNALEENFIAAIQKKLQIPSLTKLLKIKQ